MAAFYGPVDDTRRSRKAPTSLIYCCIDFANRSLKSGVSRQGDHDDSNLNHGKWMYFSRNCGVKSLIGSGSATLGVLGRHDMLEMPKAQQGTSSIWACGWASRNLARGRKSKEPFCDHGVLHGHASPIFRSRKCLQWGPTTSSHSLKWFADT